MRRAIFVPEPLASPQDALPRFDNPLDGRFSTMTWTTRATTRTNRAAQPSEKVLPRSTLRVASASTSRVSPSSRTTQHRLSRVITPVAPSKTNFTVAARHRGLTDCVGGRRTGATSTTAPRRYRGAVDEARLCGGRRAKEWTATRPTSGRENPPTAAQRRDRDRRHDGTHRSSCRVRRAEIFGCRDRRRALPDALRTARVAGAERALSERQVTRSSRSGAGATTLITRRRRPFPYVVTTYRVTEHT